jgi:hypothetical protein
MRLAASFTVALFLLLPVTHVWADLAGDLVLALSFEEGAGDMSDDLSGNGNNAEVHNAQWVDGRIGTALQFGGEDIWVTVPDSPMLNFGEGESFTLACWTKALGAGNGQGNFVAKYAIGAGTDPFYGMFLGPDHLKVHTYLRDQGKAHLVDLWSGDTIADDEWHHVALVRDAGNEVSLYVDGELNESKDDPTGDLTNTHPLAMGRHTTAEFYEGIVDEVALWRRVLSEAEIRESMGGVAAVTPSGKLAATWADIKTQ